MTSDFSHLNQHGHAAMVDVTHKESTHRLAFTSCFVRGIENSIERVRNGGEKDPVLLNARMAGLSAAKATSSLIPLCHPLPLLDLDVSFDVLENEIEVLGTAATMGQTGVEMEALTACAVAALTIISALREFDPLITMDELTLWEKRGGRSGTWQRDTAGTVTNTPFSSDENTEQ